MKKHIGIVDVTTVGTCICANEIVAEYMRRYHRNDHPEFSMHSLPYDRYHHSSIEQDWPLAAELILTSINKLKTIGADFIVIPSNTPHYAYPDIAKHSPLPVLNLIDIVSTHCAQQNFKKVAVLGTRATMTGGLYTPYLQKHGIESVTIADSIVSMIHNFIFDEIIPSQIQQETLDAVAKAINQIDCQAVLLACTELPAVYNSDNLKPIAVDTTRLLAHAALDYSQKND